MKQVYLKSLTLKGFKSFAEPTTMVFEPGLCAVVGPNGSGKSNVVDALAWVMGEQGAKTLRGATMGDVIFAGAGDHKPLGRAEVTLTIDNADGALPIDYAEVSITRRMFRDGGSEYEINGAKARLTDVQELLSDTGIGRDMHIIVGQGKITEILESKPEERRTYIEEAAGIVKHKRRKEKAERKLTSMQANLDRLTDLTDELKKQLGPLSRQAKAAERAHSVQATVREKRLIIAGYELTEAKNAADHAGAAVTTAIAAFESARSAEESTRLREQSLSDELDAARDRHEAAHTLWFSLSSLSERVAAVDRIAADRIAGFTESPYSGPDPALTHQRWEQAVTAAEEAEIAAENAKAAAAEVAQTLAAAKQTAHQAAEEHLRQVRAVADRREGAARLLADKDATENAVTEAEQRVAEAEETHRAAEQAVERAAAELASLTADSGGSVDSGGAGGSGSVSTGGDRSVLEDAVTAAATELQRTLQRLEELQAAHSEAEKTVAALSARIEALTSTRPRHSTSLPDTLTASMRALAEDITVNPGDEVAVAAALGIFATAQLIDVPLTDITAHPSHAQWPRTTFVSPDTSSPWTLDGHLPTGCRWLIDSITAPQSTGALSRLLAECIICDTPETGFAAVAHDPRLIAITGDGTVIAEKWITLGKASTSPVEVQAHINTARSELEAATTTRDEVAARIDGATEAVAAARNTHAAAQAHLVAYDTEQQAHAREIARAEKNHLTFVRQLDQATERLAAARTSEQTARTRLADLLDRISRLDTTTTAEPDSTAADAARAEVDRLQQQATQAQLAAATATEAARQARSRADSLARREQHETRDREQFLTRQATQRAAADKARHIQSATTLVGERITQAVERAHTQLTAAQQEVADLQAALAEARENARQLRHQVEQAQREAHNAQVTQAQARVRLEELEKKATGELILTADLIREEFAQIDATTFDIDTARDELAKAERSLTALGKVNPLAVEEYAALEERYNFLVTQLEDVQQARRDLRAVIAEVDETMLNLFSAAFRDVAAVFPQVFSTLFPGGEGKLTLTDPSDLLTTGIEVHARPPGKRVSRLSLLSGGEKTLTALAMLVAIFTARPSPFYVFDEVEAALDDVNLRRLLALFDQLREDSQLIVITHQKPTMDRAGIIYGVSMRGDGVTHVLSQRMSPQNG